MEAPEESSESASSVGNEGKAKDSAHQGTRGESPEKDVKRQEESPACGFTDPETTANKDDDMPQQETSTQPPKNQPETSDVAMRECLETDSECRSEDSVSGSTKAGSAASKDEELQESSTHSCEEDQKKTSEAATGECPKKDPESQGKSSASDSAEAGTVGDKDEDMDEQDSSRELPENDPENSEATMDEYPEKSLEGNSASGFATQPGSAAKKDPNQQEPSTQPPEGDSKNPDTSISERPKRNLVSEGNPSASEITEPTAANKGEDLGQQDKDASHQEPSTQPPEGDQKTSSTASMPEPAPAAMSKRGLQGWKKVPVRGTSRAYMTVDTTLLRHKWTSVQNLVDSHVRKNSVVIHTAGYCAERKRRSSWVFLAEHNHVEVFRKQECVPEVVQRPVLEELAITNALDWVTTTQTFRQVVVVSDCMSLLNKIRCGSLQGYWVQILPPSSVKTVTWVFSPASYGFETNRSPHNIAKRLCME